MNEVDKHTDNPPIWGAICAALGSEHRQAKEIVGASGLIHPVEAIGVDEVGKRLIVISSETNPRIAALLRGDIQATTSDLRVLVARPVAVNLSHAIKANFFTPTGTLDLAKLMAFGGAFAETNEESQEARQEKISALLDGVAAPQFQSAKRSALPIRNHVFNVVEQLHDIDWTRFEIPKTDNVLQLATELLTQFSNLDTLLGDREQGICPLPTYEFQETDWELFASGTDLDAAKERLKDLDIYQYFYPPADSLALGLIDRGGASDAQLGTGFDITWAQGHEITGNSLVEETSDLAEIVEQLKSKNYVMEGEFSFELTDEGRNVRKSVKFRPREGLIARISRIISVKVDLNLKDILK